MNYIKRSIVLFFVIFSLFTGGAVTAQSPIANINGVNIYSDKNVVSIINSRVNFSDGSWCDTSTGEVVNKGLGYISMDTPASATGEKKTFGPETFIANVLDVRSVTADVKIIPTNDKKMMVRIVGPESIVDNISTSLDSDTLMIEGKRQGSYKNSVTRGGNSISISSNSILGSIFSGSKNFISGNTIINTSSSGHSNTIIEVSVPKGSSIKIADIQGTVDIGDVEGPLQAVVFSNKIKAGKMRDANLTIQGSGDIIVSSIDGNLSMYVQGSGGVRVRKGLVTMLSANVQGSGDIKFGGSAIDANLSITGSGDIDIESVKNRPNMNVTGSGQISVDNW